MIVKSIYGRSFFTRLGFVALLGIGGLLGLATGLSYAAGERLVPALAVVVPAAIAAIWLFRPRSQERSQAVWNAYAEREIARMPPTIGQRQQADQFQSISSRRNIHARTQSQTR